MIKVVTPLKLIAITLFVLCVGANGVVSADNDQLPPMLSGQITAKGDREVRIDGQAYPLHREIAFADDAGHQLRWGDFRESDYVTFHLRKGQIDQLIKQLPK